MRNKRVIKNKGETMTKFTEFDRKISQHSGFVNHVAYVYVDRCYTRNENEQPDHV